VGGTYLRERRPPLKFGDICSGDFLFDVYVRADARAVIRAEMGGRFPEKMGWGSGPIPYYVPVADADEGLVVTHGRPHDVVCLSDDCLIETALGRDGRAPSGRLLFAPLQRATRDELVALDENPTYGRFPLPADELHEISYIVALRACFMVDARAVHGALPEFVLRSTTETIRLDLANRWAAYACRRGPLVVEDNLGKFVSYLAEDGAPEDEAVALGEAVAAVAGAAWAFEGRAIERAGQTADEKLAAADALRLLESDLRRVAEAVPAALERVCALASRT
jgi:hypothetical protein